MNQSGLYITGRRRPHHEAAVCCLIQPHPCVGIVRVRDDLFGIEQDNQVSERVFLDFGGELSKFLPFRDGRCLMVAMLPDGPQEAVMHRLVDIVLKNE